MNNPATAQADTGATKADAFAFVQSLATELSGKKIDLPSFPDVAIQVRKVLSDEFVSSKQVVRVVSTEPALAAKLLAMANSAAINPSGAKVVELRTAIARIGFNMVRSASLAFAMEQIRKSESLKTLRAPLNSLWERSVLVAAMSFVVARRATQVNPDTALLAGLLHGVGKLYILTRAAKHPKLFADQPTYSQIVRDWHASIAKAVLENWEISEDVSGAVEEFENLDRDHKGVCDLTDVLAVANLLASFHEFPDSLELNMQGVKACTRMNLDRAGCEAIIKESGDEIAQLRTALGN
ncbi:MAG: HDOD domain-containing protein [Steroidobacteraceae bacterium]